MSAGGAKPKDPPKRDLPASRQALLSHTPEAGLDPLWILSEDLPTSIANRLFSHLALQFDQSLDQLQDRAVRVFECDAAYATTETLNVIREEPDVVPT